MSHYQKLMEKLFGAHSDTNFSFRDLCFILIRTGFDEHVKGGHHIFLRDGVEELVNLQTYRGSKKAKAYQVRQVRDLLAKYGLDGGESR